METDKEKKNRRIGMFTSIGIHALLVILFIFIVAWKQQIPPPDQIGMSINYGTEDTGSGDVQPEVKEEAEQVQEEAVEEQSEEVEEVVDPVEAEAQPEVQEEVIKALQDEGPVKVEEKVEEAKEEVKEEKPKEVTKPVEKKPVEEKKEEVKEVVEERKVESAFKPNSDKNNNETNQGTKDNTSGDQGKEEGQLDSKSQYGGPGAGGGGFDADIAGWGTDFKLPDNKPEATGVLQFKIKVDDRGDVIGITYLKRIGDSAAEKFYYDLITRDMKFYRLAGSGQIPPLSEGVITLNLKVK